MTTAAAAKQSSKKDMEKEKEMALIWGGRKSKPQGAVTLRANTPAAHQQDPAADSDNDDAASNISFVSDTDGKHGGKGKSAASAAKKKKHEAKKNDPKMRLHTFVAPGTNKNEVRAVFEAYGAPEVELRTSQKGNAMNKTHYAVLTFRNKALALWATLHLDGSNQRDTIGINPMKLNMFLSRDQQKMVRRRAARKKSKSE